MNRCLELPPAADLFFARLSPAGQGAIGVVHLEGRGAGGLLRQVFRSRRAAVDMRPAPYAPLALGEIHDATGAIDEVLIEGPLEGDAYRINCHGGAAAVTEICRLLASLGARAGAEWEPDYRRYLRGELDAVGFEAALLLPQALSHAAAELILRSPPLLRAAPAACLPRRGAGRAPPDRLRELLAAYHTVLPLLRVHTIALAGPENCGKSTLLNAIAQRAVAVTSVLPGTTRDTVCTRLEHRGLLLEFVDTAGMCRAAADALKRTALEQAARAITHAEIVLLLSSPDTQPPGNLPESAAALLRVHNKIDLGGAVPADALGVCALSGQGVADLLDAIYRRLLPASPRPGAFTARQAAVLETVLAGRGSIAPLLECSPSEALACLWRQCA